MHPRETQITMVKWTNAGGQTKRANERSFVYRPPAWRRWRNVKTTLRLFMFLFWLQLIHWWSLLFPVSLLLFHQCGQLVAKHCLKISTYQPSPQGWNRWTALQLCILLHMKLLLLRIQDLQIQGLWKTYGKPGLVLISAAVTSKLAPHSRKNFP